MSSLLIELEQKDILTAEAVSDIRKYIAAKFPSMPSKERACVFADAVNKVVDINIPDLSDEQKLKLKGNLFKDAFSKPIFKLDRSQVFIAALGVGVEAEDKSYFKGMASWLGDALGYELDEESVASLIIRVQRLKDDVPEFGIIEALNAVEEGLAEESSVEVAEVFSYKMEEASGAIENVLIENVLQDLPGIDYSSPEEIIEDKPLIQMFAAVEVPAKKRRSRRLKAHMGKVLVAAGFTGLVLSSLLDFNIFISTGAPGSNMQEDRAAEALILNGRSSESFHNGYPYIMDFHKGNAPEDSQYMWKGKKTLKATAYDLSIESCGKQPEDPGYGITASGAKAVKGRTIAVDPKVIPLGTKVYITFPEDYNNMNGVYVAEDTGRLINGEHIDIFFGEDKNGKREIYQKAMKFGIQYVEVEIVDF